MTDGKAIVCRNVTGSEAWSAECRFDYDTGLKQLFCNVVAGGRKVYRSRLRVSGHREIIVSDRLALHDGSRLAEVIISTAGAACDDSLVSISLAVLHLALKVDGNLVAETLPGIFLNLLQDSLRVSLELMDSVGI